MNKLSIGVAFFFTILVTKASACELALTEAEVQLVLRLRNGPMLAQGSIGVRDVIDVSVQDGLIAFNGKRREYEPFSFRIIRGQTIEQIVRRKNSRTETSIWISYRSDGLHFDVPAAPTRSRVPERGHLVVFESDAWIGGAIVNFPGAIDSSTSRSEAQAVTFRIRYSLL